MKFVSCCRILEDSPSLVVLCQGVGFDEVRLRSAWVLDLLVSINESSHRDGPVGVQFVRSMHPCNHTGDTRRF